jgi:23S rRNA (cytosine1962-C5)-methyltransferase
MLPILQLKPGKDRSIRNRHPWIFSGAVRQLPDAKEGDIVQVISFDEDILGYGHYVPGRTIVCRMFHFGRTDDDFGDAYWLGKLRASLAQRRRLPLDFGETTGFRLVHAEGDSLPGLILDVYGEAASAQLRTKGMERLEPLLAQFLRDEMGIRHFFVAGDERAQVVQGGRWVFGEAGRFAFKEHGMQFVADPEHGQKTGFFLDQRDNRALLRSFVRPDTRVLNTFAYSGAFSVSALLGGAAYVQSVDISREAILLCEEHVRLNGGEDRHQPVIADAFDYLKKLKQDEFDLIVLDPPAFTKHISTVDRAARGYKEINLQAIRKVRPGGIVFTFSCSQHIDTDLFRKIVFGAASDARREVRVLHTLTQGADHPVSIFHPEGEYLKGLVLHVS